MKSINLKSPLGHIGQEGFLNLAGISIPLSFTACLEPSKNLIIIQLYLFQEICLL